MPTPPRIALALVGCAVVLVGGALSNADVSYGARQATCLLASTEMELPALATPPLPTDVKTVLSFPVDQDLPSGSTSTVLWEDVYGEQHIAVDPTDELRRQLDHNQKLQLARACASS